MRFLPCDQLAANIDAAQTRWRCKLEYELVVWLIEEVLRRYDPQQEDFETTLENALHAKRVEGLEWDACKTAVGTFFGTRAAYRRSRRPSRRKQKRHSATLTTASQ